MVIKSLEGLLEVAKRTTSAGGFSFRGYIFISYLIKTGQRYRTLDTSTSNLSPLP